jgi:hypothetical protein
VVQVAPFLECPRGRVVPNPHPLAVAEFLFFLFFVPLPQREELDKDIVLEARAMLIQLDFILLELWMPLGLEPARNGRNQGGAPAPVEQSAEDHERHEQPAKADQRNHRAAGKTQQCPFVPIPHLWRLTASQ